MILVLAFLFLSLSNICSCCFDPLISINQLVPPSSTTLNKSHSLFNMTLPIDSLSLTGLSLSCETRTGCGSLSSLTIFLLDKQVTIDSTLLQHYTTSNWSHDRSFKLYVGPISPQYLTLSVEFEATSSPVVLSSTLYGCEAKLGDVPTRQILQYDLIPTPSALDSEYTGITRNEVTSGGVGILTDQLTQDVVTWDSFKDNNISILFRFDIKYELTGLIVSSPDPLAYSLTEVSTELMSCRFTESVPGSVILSRCTGSYLFLAIKCVSESVSISEVQLLTEEGQLSGKSSPVIETPQSNTNTGLSILITILLTFLFTSLICIVTVVIIYLVINRRKGYDRWIFRSKLFHKRNGDYLTMKGSGKLSGHAEPSSQTPDTTDHVYCTLKVKDDLETSSVYVDMSGKVINKPTDTPDIDLPPVPPSPSKENNYMSMNIRSDSEPTPATGGFFSRFKNWRTQWRPLPPSVEGIPESSNIAKKNVSLNRRGGVRIKSLSQPSTPPPRLSRHSSTREDTATDI